MTNARLQKAKALLVELESLKEADPFTNRIGTIVLAQLVLAGTEVLLRELLTEAMLVSDMKDLSISAPKVDRSKPTLVEGSTYCDNDFR